MHDGALDHALKTQRRLGIDIVGTSNLRRVVFNEVAEGLAQVVHVGGAGAQHLGGTRVVKQGQQQVLHGDELVALLTRFDKGHMQADF